MYRVLLVLLILELKIIFRTSSKFVNQNTLTYTLHGTFSIFCDVPWNFVEFRMSRKSLGWAAFRGKYHSKYHSKYQANFGSEKTLVKNFCYFVIFARFEVVTSSASNNIFFGHLHPIIHSCRT